MRRPLSTAVPWSPQSRHRRGMTGAVRQRFHLPCPLPQRLEVGRGDPGSRVDGGVGLASTGSDPVVADVAVLAGELVDGLEGS
ncbi:hypothetical protein ACVWZD_008834 [Streptomyces sp. TE3672]